MTKVKNERKIQERNMMASKKQKQSLKEKEEFENKKKELEKELEQSKKKDKNNRIIIEKYKKEVEQLKRQLAATTTISNSNISK